ncbi:MAG: amino acid transporter [Vicinamibacteraceae bacterium]
MSASREAHGGATHTAPWWQVMCLTGVDYFSTLGYQPGIAFLAAGFLSPVATLVIVLVTLLGAAPVYSRIAALSPHGQGSISLLEHLLPRWKGKALVLVLLGFAATDFVLTMTLSAADATAHIIHNPLVPPWMDHRVGLTLLLLTMLGGIFLRGFREVIGLAVFIVGTYLALNFVIIFVELARLFEHPARWADWATHVHQQQGSPLMMLAFALILFPKLALGLSGFETGVAVMPHVQGDPDDSPENPAGRIRNTKKLLWTAAIVMSLALIGSSIVTTLEIPAEEFQAGGRANGRALSYLAHRDLGELFGSVYDFTTITILWFAGASAMAGLLNLIPRYLPRYGMAPDWARATRPLVLLITVITFLVTVIFDADVDAQGGAYATGVLVLMSSAAVATTINAVRERSRNRWMYLGVTLVFAYTTLANIVERPEGIKIATWFIVAIVTTSLLSRVLRSTELRIHAVQLDDTAQSFINEQRFRSGIVRIIANRRDSGLPSEYAGKLTEAEEQHHLLPDEPVLFLEVRPGDVSEFSDTLEVRGALIAGYRVLRCKSPAIPNAIAALLLHVRDATGAIPHAYFGWTEGNPIAYLFKFLAFGEGDTAPVTREILRQVEPDTARRPRIHVG